MEGRQDTTTQPHNPRANISQTTTPQCHIPTISTIFLVQVCFHLARAPRSGAVRTRWSGSPPNIKRFRPSEQCLTFPEQVARSKSIAEQSRMPRTGPSLIPPHHTLRVPEQVGNRSLKTNKSSSLVIEFLLPQNNGLKTASCTRPTFPNSFRQLAVIRANLGQHLYLISEGTGTESCMRKAK